MIQLNRWAGKAGVIGSIVSSMMKNPRLQTQVTHQQTEIVHAIAPMRR